MKSSALILLLALVMASSARADSCTHPPAYPPGSPCGSATDFHVCRIDIANPNFDPANGNYKTPGCAPPLPDLTLFNKVYTLLNARADVRTTLCTRLPHVFVLQGGSNAYGVWEVPPGIKPNGQPRPARAQGVMYIAVHPDANVGHNLAYQENKMLSAAFAPRPVPAGLVYESDDGPGDGMALLSILAHELGHLLLAETNADGTGGHNQKHARSDLCDTQLQRRNPQTCFDDDFLALWKAATFHPHMRRWIAFGGRNNNKYLDLNHDLDEAIRTRNYSNFLDGEFVSFDASASPEEDLVETYKYMILADVAQQSNLRLRIPGLANPVPVLQKVSGATAGSNLKRKIDCVNNLKPLF
jgi:hypothetical protein